VDAGVGAPQLVLPRARARRVALHDADAGRQAGGGAGAARQRDDLVAAPEERGHERAPDQAGGAGDEDLHAPSLAGGAAARSPAGRPLT
jgi:hypothetical protein